MKQGNQYQPIDLHIYAKEMPRTHLSDDKWALVLHSTKMSVPPVVALQERSDFSRTIKYLAHEGGRMQFQIGSRCATHATTSKVLPAALVRRIVQDAVGHTLSSIDL